MLKQFVILLFILLTFSCKNKSVIPPKDLPPLSNYNDTTGSVVLNIKNVVGLQDLILNSQSYVNQNLDTFKVDIYKYYVTNIELKTTNGFVYKESESYHLIDQSLASSQSFTLSNVPKGNYTSITFLIGIDKDRNTSGAQTGALDPANGMFWTWSTGYIMAMFEGKSPQSTDIDNNLIFHIAGFSGVNNVLRNVTLNFTNDSAKVSSNKTPKITLQNDVLKWFYSPNLIDFSLVNNVTSVGSQSKQIADNYVNMFKFVIIEN